MRKHAFLLLLLFSNASNAIPENDIVLNLIGSNQPQSSHSLVGEVPSGWGIGLFTDVETKKNIRFYDLVLRYTRQYNVPAALILGIIKAESNFNPNAVSRKGAKGLMQLMDSNSRHWQINPFLPEQNIKVGTAMMARLLKMYQGNIDMALAAYNAGEGTVKKYRGIPPYKETQQYIKRVKHNMKKYDSMSPAVGAFPSLYE
jgi:soluble lytic murein transglycosylase-like protein